MSFWTSWERGVSQYTQDSAIGIHKVIYIPARIDLGGEEKPAHQRTYFYFRKGGHVQAGSRTTFERYGCDWDSWATAIEQHIPTFKYPPGRYRVQTLKQAWRIECLLRKKPIENIEAPSSSKEDREEALHAAIEQLPHAQHDAIVLQMAGYSHAEMASILGCTESQSEHRVYDAMVSLKKNPKLNGF